MVGRIGKTRESIHAEILERLTTKALAFMEDAVSWVLVLLAHHVHNIIVDVITMPLHMMFWICAPTPNLQD